METCLEAFSAITDLIARAEAAEDRAEKAEMERRELASLCGKLIVLCEQPRELMEQLFMRNRGRMIGDYMGSGYPFVDAFNRIYVDFEETASDEAYKAVREATEVEAQKRGQKEE